MEPKKNPDKDLYGKSGLFLVIGFSISVGLVLGAFEWKFPAESVMGLIVSEIDDPFDMMNIKVVDPQPPHPKQHSINIVEAKHDEPPTQEIPSIDLTTDLPSSTDSLVIAPEPETYDEPVNFVEDPAAPLGGLQAFYKYVAQKMKRKYPHAAIELGIEGKVFVEFIVEKDGKLTAAKVLKGIGAGCDELALQTVLSAPPWKSARQGGKPVRQRFTLPIIFKLN